MLRLVIPEVDLWDEQKEEFIHRDAQTLQLEHSLVSLRKWESKWCKPFLSTKEKTLEETIDYIKCMTITQNVNPETYKYLTNDNIAQINEYIAAPMTATTFSGEDQKKGSREIITSEIITYWMIALQIPVQYEKWHLNSLLTQIRVCNIKNQPPKKRKRGDVASSYAKLNAARKQQLNTRG